MKPIFMIQRLSEFSKSAIQLLKTIRFNHLSYYINDKKCVSELMSSEFQEYSDNKYSTRIFISNILILKNYLYTLEKISLEIPSLSYDLIIGGTYPNSLNSFGTVSLNVDSFIFNT